MFFVLSKVFWLLAQPLSIILLLMLAVPVAIVLAVMAVVRGTRR